MHARYASGAAAVWNVGKLEPQSAAAIADRNAIHAACQRRVLQAEGGRSDAMLCKRNGNGSQALSFVAENLREVRKRKGIASASARKYKSKSKCKCKCKSKSKEEEQKKLLLPRGTTHASESARMLDAADDRRRESKR